MDLLRQLNADGAATCPDETPLDFVPARWRPYVNDNPGRIDRAYFELCVLWELRGALRAGDVWLEGSRRYADPETYLIPRERWPGLRAEVCRQLQVSGDGTDRLREREEELEGLLDRVEALLAASGASAWKTTTWWSPPWRRKSEPESTVELERLIDERLPLVELSELLIEVDGWTRFSDDFEHAGGRSRGAANSEPPLCVGPRPGVQPRPDPDGADLRPDLPEAGLVHELVSSATRP